MLNEGFYHWCIQLQQLTQAKRWRSLIVLVGDEVWTTGQLETCHRVFISDQSTKVTLNKPGLFYGDIDDIYLSSQLTHVNRKNYNQYLGSEQSLVVFTVDNNIPSQLANIESDFDVDAFAALSGTLVAGSSLVLILSPSQLNTSLSKDYFLQRFIQQLGKDNCYVINQEQALLPKLIALQEPATSRETSINDGELAAAKCLSTLPYGCMTQEQVLAVEVMLKVLSGHRGRPLVLTADRGRGKSTALALAACQMLKNAQQPLKIMITAASKQALTIFFQQIAQHLPTAKVTATQVEHPNGCITFYPIDRLLKEQPEASIILVDEAAAIPVYLLQQLLSIYHRLIFSTTIHGYEGAGRGFSIKFRQILQRLMPHWRNIHINEPVRWAIDDPLEKFIFDSCLLNAQLPTYNHALTSNKSGVMVDDNSIDPSAFNLPSSLNIELISVETLLNNEVLLQQVFSVLVTAHYQTSPSDLRLLLNNSAISLFVLKQESDIVGVAMLMREGQVDEILVEQVLANKRRLRDQFLPQSLMMHCGIKTSFNYSYQRVMRIAIHPEIQGQGLGQYFLKCIEQHSVMQNIDFIGASFAGNSELVKFWQQAGFSLARVGFSKDKASGEHSCLVTKALTPNAKNLQHAFTEQFYLQLSYWLTDEFKDMPAKLVWQLLNGNTELKRLEFTPELAETLNDFTSGQRQFSSCIYALHRWLISHLTEDFDAGVLPLIARILQKHSIEQVCKQYSFTGKKSLNQHLIHYISLH
tara:strand:+ start:5309 stop:7564 length:2256 start_codon:yes stop_codon:yes gene_type:complete